MIFGFPLASREANADFDTQVSTKELYSCSRTLFSLNQETAPLNCKSQYLAADIISNATYFEQR